MDKELSKQGQPKTLTKNAIAKQACCPREQQRAALDVADFTHVQHSRKVVCRAHNARPRILAVQACCKCQGHRNK